MPLGMTLLVCTLAITSPPSVRAPAATTAAVEFHVRTTDPQVRAWIEHGAAESPTLRALLAQLAATDIIVYVQVVDRIAGGAYGQLYFVKATETVRYVRVEIVRGRNHADTIALIAHELTHAAEVAAAPRVRDGASLAMLYLGMFDNAMTDRGHYDSAAARATESIVRAEVAAYRTPPDPGVRTIARLNKGGYAAR